MAADDRDRKILGSVAGHGKCWGEGRKYQAAAMAIREH